jgi:hypothetical protein
MGLSCIIDSLVGFEGLWIATMFSWTVRATPLSSIFASFSWTFGAAPLLSSFSWTFGVAPLSSSFSWTFGAAPLSSLFSWTFGAAPSSYIFVLVFCFFWLSILALSPYLVVFFLGFLFL